MSRSGDSARSSQETVSFQTQLVRELRGLEYRRPRVDFLLGSDEFIHQERRVAMTPEHIVQLREGLLSCGLEPRIHVVRGAGERAGDDAGEVFEDRRYEAAGASLVAASRVAELGGVDVVHALKEPTDYESHLRGPLLRIGALHLASKPPGLCPMLAKKNFAAIIDGGTVGSCSYLLHGGDRTPIVASMSRFAGWLSGKKVVQGLAGDGLGPGRIVVVGGGVAGCAAIEKVRPMAAELVVVERFEPTRERLPGVLTQLGFSGRFRVEPELREELLDDAVAVVFAHRSGAKKAEKVCDYDRHIRRMRRGAAIADIAIDQGGSISHSGYNEEDDAAASLAKYKALLSPDYAYYAETNMPRADPHNASLLHGDASLPYITAVLALCARHGGPAQATREILKRPARAFSPTEKQDVHGRSLLDCVAQDLRNGFQVVCSDGAVEITDPDIEKHPSLVEWVHHCAGG